MKTILIGLATTQTILYVTLGTPSPANALSAELAKKCRDMAIKSHPPPTPPGNKAYAQAEREFFRACVSRNGRMPDDASPDQPDPAQH
jgi:hypothetical protein